MNSQLRVMRISHAVMEGRAAQRARRDPPDLECPGWDAMEVHDGALKRGSRHVGNEVGIIGVHPSARRLSPCSPMRTLQRKRGGCLVAVARVTFLGVKGQCHSA